MKTAIIILSKNIQLLEQCLESIKPHTYKNTKIYIGDTGLSSTDSLIQYKDNIEIIKIPKYKFSSNCNFIVKKVKADFLIFMNDDIVMMPKYNVIGKMQEYFKENFKGCGTIGTRLFYPDNSVQHGGVIFVNAGGTIHPTHAEYKQKKYSNEDKEVLGSTAALMGVNKKVFDDIGGFDETYEENYEDVKFNLECKIKGLKNVFLGKDLGAYHLESATRKQNKDMMSRAARDNAKFKVWYVENYSKFMT